MSTLESEAPEQGPFESQPEPRSIKNGIEQVGDHTVMAVLGVAVVARVMSGRLEDAAVVEEIHQPWIFGARPMRPLVELVGVDADGNDQDDLPLESADGCGAGENEPTQDEQNIGALEPGVAREFGGIVVVEDVGLRNQPSCHRPMRLTVGVLEPMKQTREKVGQ
ncbi:MAG TPA: hypothetical protein VGX68_21445 [Thermoanaerobaculia bacterium]|nr:hypothetical protein [Thermoanaerobaculia bacterium]